MKAFIVGLVLLIVLGLAAFRAQATDLRVDCGVVTGSMTATVKGVDWAEKLGGLIRQVADHPAEHRDRATVKAAVDGTMRVLWLWIRTAWLSARGEKLDPQIIQLRDEQRQAAAQARQSCQPCPTEGTPDDDNQSPDPRAMIGVVDRSLHGAALAASAARAAGFPEAEIRMAVQVAKLESSWRPTATLTYRGMHMRGMWQINDHAHPKLMKLGDWRDPYVNARMAYRVWVDAGRSWYPWSTAAAARRSLPDRVPDTGKQAQLEQDQPADCVEEEGAAGPTRTADFSAFRNPRSVDEAVDFMATMARNDTSIRSGACLHYVALAYGYPTTMLLNGRWWAKDQYYASSHKHPGDRDAPRGALMFWDTGAGRPGHIAISAGDGRVYSTDAPRRGQVGLVPFSYFRGYGKFLGWTPPDFARQTKEASAA